MEVSLSMAYNRPGSIVVNATNYASVINRNLGIVRNSKFWHAFVLNNLWKGATRNEVLQTVLDHVYPLDLIPVHYTQEGKSAMFIARNCAEAIEKFSKDGLLILHPNNEKENLKLEIVLKYSTLDKIKIDAQKNISIALNNRLRDKVLNLEKFHEDNALTEFTPLSQPKIMYFVLHVAKPLNPKFLSLKSNGIKTLFPLEAFWGTPLAKLDLGNNKLENISQLDPIKQLDIKELNLEGNPLCDNYDEQTYVQRVLEVCPNLTTLDGVVLKKFGFPVPRNVYLCDNRGRDFVDRFLEYYYTVFDSRNRNDLLGLYNESAMFSMTVMYKSGQTTSMNAKLRPYQTISRNLKQLADLSKNGQFLFRGNSSIVNVLCKLPYIEHDPFSFQVDLILFTSTCVSLVVSGIFREPPVNLLENERVVGFARTFVLKSTDGLAYTIVNDMLHLYNAFSAQEVKAFEFPKPVPSLNPFMPNSYKERCKLAETVGLITGLTSEWATKLLESNQYDLKKTISDFVDLYKVDKIPVNGFKNKEDAGYDQSPSKSAAAIVSRTNSDENSNTDNSETEIKIEPSPPKSISPLVEEPATFTNVANRNESSHATPLELYFSLVQEENAPEVPTVTCEEFDFSNHETQTSEVDSRDSLSESDDQSNVPDSTNCLSPPQAKTLSPFDKPNEHASPEKTMDQTLEIPMEIEPPEFDEIASVKTAPNDVQIHYDTPIAYIPIWANSDIGKQLEMINNPWFYSSLGQSSFPNLNMAVWGQGPEQFGPTINPYFFPSQPALDLPIYEDISKQLSEVDPQVVLSQQLQVALALKAIEQSASAVSVLAQCEPSALLQREENEKPVDLISSSIKCESSDPFISTTPPLQKSPVPYNPSESSPNKTPPLSVSPISCPNIWADPSENPMKKGASWTDPSDDFYSHSNSKNQNDVSSDQNLAIVESPLQPIISESELENIALPLTENAVRLSVASFAYISDNSDENLTSASPGFQETSVVSEYVKETIPLVKPFATKKPSRWTNFTKDNNVNCLPAPSKTFPAKTPDISRMWTSVSKDVTKQNYSSENAVRLTVASFGYISDNPGKNLTSISRGFQETSIVSESVKETIPLLKPFAIKKPSRWTNFTKDPSVNCLPTPSETFPAKNPDTSRIWTSTSKDVMEQNSSFASEFVKETIPLPDTSVLSQSVQIYDDPNLSKNPPSTISEPPQATYAYINVNQINMCYRCGLTGHKRLYCPGPTIIFCSLCGRVGIMSRKCTCLPNNNSTSQMYLHKPSTVCGLKSVKTTQETTLEEMSSPVLNSKVSLRPFQVTTVCKSPLQKHEVSLKSLDIASQKMILPLSDLFLPEGRIGNPDLCWKCGNLGHSRTKCTGAALSFCSRCGRLGVHTKECVCPPTNYSRGRKPPPSKPLASSSSDPQKKTHTSESASAKTSAKTSVKYHNSVRNSTPCKRSRLPKILIQPRLSSRSFQPKLQNVEPRSNLATKKRALSPKRAAAGSVLSRQRPSRKRAISVGRRQLIEKEPLKLSSFRKVTSAVLKSTRWDAPKESPRLKRVLKPEKKSKSSISKA